MRWLLLPLLILLVTGCTQPPARLDRAWVISDGMSEDDEKAITYDVGLNKGGLTTASFIDLQRDGSFHSNLFEYDHGKWRVQDNILILSGQLSKPVYLHVNKVTDKELIVTDYKQRAWYHLRGHPNQFATPADNPFAAENNLWRIPARKKETDRQIAFRLHNHFRFWEKYFSWGNKEKIKLLYIGATPSPLQLFGNGFELTYYHYEPMGWVKLFYDTADCYKAYEKLYYLFAEKDIKWPKNKDRFESFIDAFQQLQAWIDEKQNGNVRKKKNPIRAD